MRPETKREILIAREAVKEALLSQGYSLSIVNSVAREKYPLPFITRLRVVTDESDSGNPVEWRLVGDQLQVRMPTNPVHMPNSYVGPNWQSATIPFVLRLFPSRIKMLAELIENPTEWVEDTDV